MRPDVVDTARHFDARFVPGTECEPTEDDHTLLWMTPEEAARRAEYGRGSVRLATAEQLERYFTPCGPEQWALRPAWQVPLPTEGNLAEVRMQDFRDALYFPIQEFMAGGNPYDPVAMFAQWPVCQSLQWITSGVQPTSSIIRRTAAEKKRCCIPPGW